MQNPHHGTSFGLFPVLNADEGKISAPGSTVKLGSMIEFKTQGATMPSKGMEFSKDEQAALNRAARRTFKTRQQYEKLRKSEYELANSSWLSRFLMSDLLKRSTPDKLLRR